MKFRRTAWLGIAVLAVAGCSSPTSPQGEASASASPPQATTEPSVTADVIPPGTYTADIPEGGEVAPGEWTMEVGPDSIMWTHPEGQTFSPGEVLEMTSSGIVFAPDPACPDQDGEPTEGSYEWSWDGEQLRFTLDSDSCAGRRDTLTSAPWEPAP